jgi:hypothetical protein
MSDSESDQNLSDLEAQQDANASGSDEEEAEKPELKGILDDVEETEVSWKDLVSFGEARVNNKILIFDHT